jgi:hypothetical protein
MAAQTLPLTTRFAAALPLLALCALAATGCKQEPNCPELDDCGGADPIGTWVLAPGYPSCIEDLYIPPSDLRLTQNDKTPAGIKVPEPAVYDWCDQLIASGGPMIVQIDPNFFYDSAPVAQSSVTFNPNGSYTASITKVGTFWIDFPAACVRSFGAMDGKVINPDDPTSPVGNVCKQLERPINQGGTNSGAYFNTVCDPNPDDPQGCLCHFDVTSTGGPGGDWYRTGNTIQLINQNSFPSYVNFCNKSTELDLTAKNGDYLFGVKGLRTMKLQAGMQPTP